MSCVSLLYSAQALDTHAVILIRSFNASATWRREGTAARDDSEMARGEPNA